MHIVELLQHLGARVVARRELRSERNDEFTQNNSVCKLAGTRRGVVHVRPYKSKQLLLSCVRDKKKQGPCTRTLVSSSARLPEDDDSDTSVTFCCRLSLNSIVLRCPEPGPRASCCAAVKENPQ